ncbi:hypothetical protein BGW36DRAFT_427830 [Talaromyces proteolyticus]|uniref:Uncharacterized protein n=1 Tax=Talaromyces proteolyticus TaxID=1131652 RepID=A0AAD4PYM6_9EURO|nr:uncharacterized protein BGW36DRAFT_427830 [Talaromyces proteolyticus]KAH8697889.1 hypothetical protein BGW36DRAFT_427830 [Talaromyces proteolyticus]
MSSAGNFVLRPGPKQIGNERGLNVLDRLANLENSLPELHRRISLLEETRVSEPNERIASLEEARVSELNRRITSLEEVRIFELNGRIALLEEAGDVERRRMLLIRASNLEKASGEWFDFRGWFDFRVRNERNRLVHRKDIELDLEALEFLRTDPTRYQSTS